MIRKLDVIYAGWGERWLLGTLADPGSGRSILFEYSAEARQQGLELSPLRMPLTQTAAFVGETFFHGLPGLIADALPDGWGMLLMDRAIVRAGGQPSTVSPLERLAYLGERAMGALCFAPAADVALTDDDVSLTKLAQEIDLILDDVPADEALRHLLLLGGSPQGARPKVLVNFNARRGRISNGAALHDPAASPPDTAPWIIKFPARQEHRDACAVEELYARVARHCELDMPITRYFDLPGQHSAFGAQRFDRVAGQRVPLLSLSALLHADHRMPALDYEMLLRATRRITGDEREVQRAFERCVLNVLLHNRDDHSRNFAYRLDHNRRWHLAPLFDLTFCPGPRGEHFTTIAGEGRAPTRAHLLQVAQRGGIALKSAQATINRLHEGVAVLPKLATKLPIRKTRLAEIMRVLQEDWRRVKEGA